MPISVLLAEDNETMRKAIARILEADEEIQVVAQATTLAQTLEFARELCPQVVVMDLHLGDERQVSPADLKAAFGGARVLAMSIWGDAETKMIAERFGAVALLDKAKLGTELIPAVKHNAAGSASR